ncbi:hypothetical protein SAMN05660649_03183 [Desulfotomaculum arcticum]|uniref:Flavodoxin n=1 Tax=Desulfotruncus arcticus DSM 17038 TaxID=1121424 RepID=A0A1I2VXE6_9FIRM|nr:hypothetical protein SAMN05660649_03183 [Desulfotomaculum arcticum] [Desulfotruncus arcticus DSM 17038]
MKALVIYFSQTGNTRRIAKCIRNGIMDVTGQCPLSHSQGNLAPATLTFNYWYAYNNVNIFAVKFGG